MLARATASTARALVDAIGDTHRLLKIKGRQYTSYQTMYFDTPDLTSVSAHIQRRRRRWKVRSRLYVEDDLYDYAVGLTSFTRSHGRVALGASPRATLGLLQAAKAWALLHGRPFVAPDDLRAVAPHVLSHRLVLTAEHDGEARAREAIIDEAIDFIDINKGCITVDAVAAYLRISRRYLEKKFLEKVGISPKYYARVKRFSVLSNEIAHSKRIDWQHIVSHYGFHDQSHLVKEFLEFNQMNPTQYHLLHKEMVRLISNE